MKGSKWITAFLAAGLGALLAFGAVGTMASAFSLTLGEPERLKGALAAACILGAALWSWKYGGIVVLAGGTAGAVWMFRSVEFGQQFWQLIYRISHFYDAAYHWGVFKLVDTAWNDGTAELPMLALGVILAAAGTRAVCRGSGTAEPVALSFLALLPCLIVTNTVPAPGSLYCLLLGVILLLITGGVRRYDRYQADRLTLLSALPAALLLGGLFFLVPQEGFVDKTESLRQEMLRWMEDLSSETTLTQEEPGFTASRGAEQSLDLRNLGPRRNAPTPVMEVTAKTGGRLYLREQDYDSYDGAGWKAEENRVESFEGGGADLGYVSIRTRSLEDRVYLPYYPRGGVSLIGGGYDNLRIAREYSFIRTGLPETGRNPALTPASGDGRYLRLPESTRTEAERLLSTVLTEEMTLPDKAAAIADYVRDCARYDLNTGRMPEEQGDFALWFLREADSGYCVHFATAAAVLLRSADMEARYVSGYLVSAKPEQTVTVTQQQSHAWVEYYDPSLGVWIPLEATPGEALPALPEAIAGETLPQTVPRETAEVTEPVPQPTAQPLPETVPEITADPPPIPAAQENGAAPGKTVLLLAAAYLLLEGQRLLRLKLLRRHGQGANRQGLARWREAERLARHLKEPAPGRLRALAEKAKFSPHTLTKTELREFDQYLTDAGNRLKSRRWYRRLADRYLFALY